MATAVKRLNQYDSYKRVPYGSYDGSAARQLEEHEVLQPRPLVRPRERVVARPRVQVREAGRVSFFAVTGFLAIGVCVVLLLMGYVQLTTVSEQVVTLRTEMIALQGQEAQLRAQYELAYDLATIEANAASRGMSRPQNSQIFYVDLAEADTVTLFNREMPATGIAGATESAKSIWSEIVEYFS